MTKYARQIAMAQRLIAQKGFAATIRAADTASDPVTGSGASSGATRTVKAVKVAVDKRAFSESLAQNATCTLICAGDVLLNENWIDGSDVRPVIAVQDVSPDNDTNVIVKALIGA